MHRLRELDEVIRSACLAGERKPAAQCRDAEREAVFLLLLGKATREEKRLTVRQLLREASENLERRRL